MKRVHPLVFVVFCFLLCILLLHESWLAWVPLSMHYAHNSQHYSLLLLEYYYNTNNYNTMSMMIIIIIIIKSSVSPATRRLVKCSLWMCNACACVYMCVPKMSNICAVVRFYYIKTHIIVFLFSPSSSSSSPTIIMIIVMIFVLLFYSLLLMLLSWCHGIAMCSNRKWKLHVYK